MEKSRPHLILQKMDFRGKRVKKGGAKTISMKTGHLSVGVRAEGQLKILPRRGGVEIQLFSFSLYTKHGEV